MTLKRDGVVLDLVPPLSKVNNLIFGRTWVDSPGEMIMTNLTTGDKAVLYFQPCGWFGYGFILRNYYSAVSIGTNCQVFSSLFFEDKNNSSSIFERISLDKL